MGGPEPRCRAGGERVVGGEQIGIRDQVHAERTPAREIVVAEGDLLQSAPLEPPAVAIAITPAIGHVRDLLLAGRRHGRFIGMPPLS